MSITIRFVLMTLLACQCIVSMPTYADVPPACTVRFTDGGAVPGTPSCVVDAVTSSAGLSSFACTADDGAIAEEFCGAPLVCPENTFANNDGACEQITTCEFGLYNASTGMCPAKPKLAKYEQNTKDAECIDPLNPLPNAPSGVTIITSPGIPFLTNKAAANVGTLTTIISGVNVVQASQYGKETGDYSQLGDIVYGIMLPGIPKESLFGRIFNTFFTWNAELKDTCK